MHAMYGCMLLLFRQVTCPRFTILFLPRVRSLLQGQSSSSPALSQLYPENWPEDGRLIFPLQFGQRPRANWVYFLYGGVYFEKEHLLGGLEFNSTPVSKNTIVEHVLVLL